jgi:phosphoribosyl 1,2-cyclic phosphodiesterase
MRVTVLASGSKGNATLFQAGNTAILVDSGIGPKVISQRMLDVLGSTVDVQAIVATHAHSDHVRNLTPCAKHFGAVVYVTVMTRRAIKLSDALHVRLYRPTASFTIGDLQIHPCPVPHDAPQVGLVVQHKQKYVGLVTDLGETTEQLKELVKPCQTLLIESNHDHEMLTNGPYPAYLKKRILSDKGHLSNQQCADFLSELSPATKKVVLMHLSQTNNTPHLAMTSAKAVLPPTVTLQCAHQTTPLDFIVPDPTTTPKLTLPKKDPTNQGSKPIPSKETPTQRALRAVELIRKSKAESEC